MKILCFFGIHFWNIVKEKHRVINHPNEREYVRIIVRVCDNCGKRQYSRSSLKKRFGFSWKNCTFDKDSVINTNEIN